MENGESEWRSGGVERMKGVNIGYCVRGEDMRERGCTINTRGLNLPNESDLDYSALQNRRK